MNLPNLENAGLVLEGGGFRGIYTTGVLDYFMEQGLYLPMFTVFLPERSTLSVMLPNSLDATHRLTSASARINVMSARAICSSITAPSIWSSFLM